MLQPADMAARASAQALREQGQRLLDQGDHIGAAAAFTAALGKLEQGGGGPSSAATAASNTARGELHLGVARALAACGSPSAHDLARAAAALAAALALLPPAHLSGDASVGQLYASLAAASAAPDFPGVVLPADPSSIRHATDSRSLESALLEQGGWVVLSPGTYTLPDESPAQGFTLLGLGAGVHVRAHRDSAHAVWVRDGSVTLANLRLSGNGAGAAVCVSPGDDDDVPPGMSLMMQMMMGGGRAPRPRGGSPKLRMLFCRVHDYSEAGLLVEGEAVLLGCSFERCSLHAVELRKGGTLVARDTTIANCKQGGRAPLAAQGARGTGRGVAAGLPGACSGSQGRPHCCGTCRRCCHCCRQVCWRMVARAACSSPTAPSATLPGRACWSRARTRTWRRQRSSST